MLQLLNQSVSQNLYCGPSRLLLIGAPDPGQVEKKNGSFVLGGPCSRICSNLYHELPLYVLHFVKQLNIHICIYYAITNYNLILKKCITCNIWLHLVLILIQPVCRLAERIMRKAEMEEAKEGVKIAGRTLNNLRYADDTTLRQEK